MSNSTLWPLRRALSRALRDAIIGAGLPAINAYLSTNMLASVPATVVQFGEASVILGSLPAIGEATLEIDQPQEQTSRLATDTFETMLISTLTLSATRAGDCDPEDFKLVGDVVCDNLRDVFNQAAQMRLTALRSDGAPYLPPGAVFQDCVLYSILHPKSVQREGDKVTTSPKWTMYHRAFITYSNVRPDALGLP